MKFYKVISKDNKAKDGGRFDYTKYLPKDDNSQEWLPEIQYIVECSKGYHVTNYWNMWLESKDNKIFEVEVKGLLDKKETVGVVEKQVCSSFRFVKEVKVTFDEKTNTGDWNTGYRNTGYSNTGYCNTGNCNTGNCNTGNRNTGNRNTGNRNTGDWNTGYRNTGNRNTGDSNTGDWNTGNSNTGYWNTGYKNTGNSNTGDWNTGYRNTGDCNTGNRNTGDRNTGYRNTGDCNTGYWNTGNRNTGNRNTGNRNTGNRNTGDWNTSNNNTGFFNTKEVKIIKVFNKDCEKKIWDKYEKPNFIYFDLTQKNYKECFKESFEKATKEDVELLLKLPNFDYKVFKEISGITKKMITQKLK